MKKILRHRWAFGCAGLIALFAVATPAASSAQTEQKIVMRCTYDGYNNQTLDYVLDLAAKTVSLTHTIEVLGQRQVNRYAGSLTQVTDDQIIWVYSDQARSVTDTLNRYSGQITEQVTFHDGNNLPVNVLSCHRQQKQF